MRICGSCYTLVSAENSDTTCPRCLDALEPTPISRLRKFIQFGTDPTKKGVRLVDAQDAATKILGELQLIKLHLEQHHKDWWSCCSECCQHETHGGYK